MPWKRPSRSGATPPPASRMLSSPAGTVDPHAVDATRAHPGRLAQHLLADGGADLAAPPRTSATRLPPLFEHPPVAAPSAMLPPPPAPPPAPPTSVFDIAPAGGPLEPHPQAPAPVEPAPSEIAPPAPTDATPPPAPDPAPAPPAPASPTRHDPGPHPSGLGAVELGAAAEEGIIELTEDLSVLRDLLEALRERSVLPDDFPRLRPIDQRAMVESVAADIASPLDRCAELVDGIVPDLGLARRALDEVRGELERVGLPRTFFPAMDAAAADLGQLATACRQSADALARRLLALGALSSTMRHPAGRVHTLVGRIDDGIERYTSGPDDVIDLRVTSGADRAEY